MEEQEISDNIGPLETYSVDISIDKSKIIFGGQDNTFSIIHTFTNDLIFQSPDLQESIFFSKFYESNIVVVLVDGTILVYDEDYNIKLEFKDENTVTFANIFEDHLVVANESYILHLFNLKKILNYEICLPSLKLIDIQSNNGILYILTEHKLLFYSLNTQKLDFFNKPIDLASALCVKESLIVIKQMNSLIFIRNNYIFLELPFEYEVESIVSLKNFILVGGLFNFLLIYDLNYKIERRITLQCEGITKIKIRNNKIFFSTFNEVFGFGDFENILYFETEVDTVFDFEVTDSFFVLGGLNGISIQKID